MFKTLLRWLGFFFLTYIVISLFMGLAGCATRPPTTTDNVGTVSTSTESDLYAVAKPASQIFGVNGQIDFNRVSYNNLLFQIAGDSMHLDAIRYPGGTVSQGFNYLTDTPSLYSLAMFTNYCSIRKVFFVLNIHTSTLDEQLKMLLLAHSLHLFTDTLYVELGNEYVEPHDDKLLNKCAVWYNALKSQYPHVQVGIPGGAPRKWNASVLNRLPDAFLVDHYHNPNNYTKNGITDTAAIAAMMQADKKNFFAGISPTRLWVTEFNLQIDDNTTPYFANDAQKELAVSFMYRWFANRGFAVVLFHNICMASNNGAIVTDSRGSYLSPTGIAIRNFIGTIK